MAVPACLTLVGARKAHEMGLAQSACHERPHGVPAQVRSVRAFRAESSIMRGAGCNTRRAKAPQTAMAEERGTIWSALD